MPVSGRQHNRTVELAGAAAAGICAAPASLLQRFLTLQLCNVHVGLAWLLLLRRRRMLHLSCDCRLPVLLWLLLWPDSRPAAQAPLLAALLLDGGASQLG